MKATLAQALSRTVLLCRDNEHEQKYKEYVEHPMSRSRTERHSPHVRLLDPIQVVCTRNATQEAYEVKRLANSVPFPEIRFARPPALLPFPLPRSLRALSYQS